MIDKTVLVDAIIGVGVNNFGIAEKYTKLGLVEFCGNQWNEDWEWVPEKLKELSTKELSSLYNEIKNGKYKNKKRR